MTAASGPGPAADEALKRAITAARRREALEVLHRLAYPPEPDGNDKRIPPGPGRRA